MQKPSKEQDLLFNKVRCNLDLIHEHIKRRHQKKKQQSYVTLALAALARFEMLIDLVWCTSSIQLKRKLMTATDDWSFSFMRRTWSVDTVNVFNTRIAPLQDIMIQHAQSNVATIERGLDLIHDNIPSIYLPKRTALSVGDLIPSKRS